MRNKLIIIAVLAMRIGAHWVAAQGTAFIYNGFLTDNGSPANGIYDLRFTIYDAASGGDAVAGPIDKDDTGITNAVFMVTLDPGAGVFTGAARWLEIAVRPGFSSGAYTNLVPRQPITATPYAIYAGAVSAAGINGTIADGLLSGNIARLNANQTFTGAVTFDPASGAALTVDADVIAKGPTADVRAFGAAGDGTTDDTATLQAAIDSLTNGGTILLPKGTYRTTAPLVITEDDVTIYGDAATILAAHDDIALNVNPSWPALSNLSIDGNLTLRKHTPDATMGSIGLRLRNSYHGQLRGFTVQGFNYGIYMLGEASGCVHNLVEPRGMYDNEIQLYMTTLSVSNQTGWVNQNTFIGGRWEYFSGGGSNAVHLWINNNNYGNNGNQFLHLGLEAPFNGTKAVRCDGILNTFIDIRTEGSTAWEFGSNANRNVVFLGTYVTSDQITDLGSFNKIMLPNFESFHFTSNLELGKIVTGFAVAGLTPETHLTVGSADTSQTIGINLPVMDGVQNTRAWLTVDAGARRLDLSHAWSSGGDLDYHLSRDRLVIKTDGNVGIGTTNPASALEVAGTVTATAFNGAFGGDGSSLTNLPAYPLAGTYSNALMFDNPANMFTGKFTGDGSMLTNVNAANLGGLGPSDFWKVLGNAGTTAGTHFLGTTDDQPLEIKVHGLRALRLEENGDSTRDSDTTPDGAPNLIAGSPRNFVGAGVVGATIAGGGATNYDGVSYTNSVLGDFGSVGGGIGNRLAPTSLASTIAGGQGNSIGTNAYYNAIGGGVNNKIGNTASRSAIAGGANNDIGTNTYYAFIGGGYLNRIGTNTGVCTIGGGDNNEIGGGAHYATIPGGRYNEVLEDYGFAAGRRAKSEHTGSFVWADSTDADFVSERTGQFRVRAGGGARFDINSGDWVEFRYKGSIINPPVKVIDTSTGAYLAAGGVWTDSSDRNRKENFCPVNGGKMLVKVLALPITTWNYKAEDAGVRHVGPVAQDFHAAFAVGADDKHIAALDGNGVALAAIQGLNQKVEERSQESGVRSQELKRTFTEELQRRDADLRQRLDQNETELKELKQTVSELKRLVESLLKNGGGQ